MVVDYELVAGKRQLFSMKKAPVVCTAAFFSLTFAVPTRELVV